MPEEPLPPTDLEQTIQWLGVRLEAGKLTIEEYLREVRKEFNDIREFGIFRVTEDPPTLIDSFPNRRDAEARAARMNSGRHRFFEVMEIK